MMMMMMKKHKNIFTAQENLESTILMFHLRSTVNATTKTLNTASTDVEFCYEKSHRQPILVKIRHRIEKEISAETTAI